MAFTIKDIFPKLEIPQEEMTRHRMAVGLRVRDSWNSKYDNPPPKVEEDGYLANAYTEDFRPKATEIIKKYLADVPANAPAPPPPVASPQPETRRKRPRIKVTALRA